MGNRTTARAAAVLAAVLPLLAACERGGSPRADAASSVATMQQVEKFDATLARHLPPNVSPDRAEQGHQLFIVCATCHGMDGRGTQLGPSLRDREWIGISGEYEEIQRVIREGVAEPEEYPVPMPAGGGGAFNAEQVGAVAAYVYALSRSGAEAAPAQ